VTVYIAEVQMFRILKWSLISGVFLVFCGLPTPGQTRQNMTVPSRPISELTRSGISVAQTLRQDHDELVASLVIVNSGPVSVEFIPGLCRVIVGQKTFPAETSSDIMTRTTKKADRRIAWNRAFSGPGQPPTTTHRDKINATATTSTGETLSISGTATHTEIDQAAWEKQKEAYQKQLAEYESSLREGAKLEADRESAGLLSHVQIEPNTQIAGELRFAVKARKKDFSLELAFGSNVYTVPVPKAQAPQ